jgi:hypothetical protein
VSVLSFLLSIATVPAAKLRDPSVLYQQELAPSPAALIALAEASAILTALRYLAWSGRVVRTASREQQREAEEHA